MSLTAALYKHIRLPVLAITSAALVACTTSGYDFSDIQAPVAATPMQNTTQPPADQNFKPLKFADSKPHEWDKTAPWHYPVHGTDVSKYQGIIDWAQVRQSGISFAFIKATEGGDRVDDTFSRNWNSTKQVGIKRGAYHFYYYCRSAKDQAKWFIRNVPKDNGALPPVLDMEWNHLSPTCKIRPPADKVRSEMKIFLSMVEKYYGKKPIIYTTVDFFDRNDLQLIKGYTFWLRSVAGHPDEKYGNHPWTFWQYTGTGRINGINGNADINTFSGSQAEWQNWSR